MSTIDIASLASDAAPVNVVTLAQKLRSHGPQFSTVAEALNHLQRANNQVFSILRAAPTINSISIDSADIADLVVGAESGPGQLTVKSGPPSYETIGFIGTEPSGETPINIDTAVNGVITTLTAHGRSVGDIVLIEGNTSIVHLGYWEIASVGTTTEFTVADPPTGSGTGGTSTWQWAGGWFKILSVGGSDFSTAKLRAKANGDLTITDASISITTGTITTIINNTTNLGYVSALYTYVTSGGSKPVVISPGNIYFAGNNASTSPRILLSVDTVSGGYLGLYDTANNLMVSLNGATGAADFKSLLINSNIVINTSLRWSILFEPDADNTRDIGSATRQFKDIRISGSLIMGGTTVINSSLVAANLTGLTSSGTITFSGLTASRPVKTNGSSALTAALIDISSASDVTGTLPVASGGTGSTTAGGARSNLSAAQSSGFGSGTATLAAITGGGSNGSLSWNADGCITAYTAPT